MQEKLIRTPIVNLLLSFVSLVLSLCYVFVSNKRFIQKHATKFHELETRRIRPYILLKQGAYIICPN